MSQINHVIEKAAQMIKAIVEDSDLLMDQMNKMAMVLKKTTHIILVNYLADHLMILHNLQTKEAVLGHKRME